MSKLDSIVRSIKRNNPRIWDKIEIINGQLNKFLLHKEIELLQLYITNYSVENDISFRVLNVNDVKMLYRFLKQIPKEDLIYFNPFPFDYESLVKVLKRNNFLTFIVFHGIEVEGLFFLRIIFTKKAYLGLIVTRKMRNKGLGKAIIKTLKEACQQQRIRLFSSVSKDNISSLKAHTANSFVEKMKLEGNYILLESEPNK